MSARLGGRGLKPPWRGDTWAAESEHLLCESHSVVVGCVTSAQPSLNLALTPALTPQDGSTAGWGLWPHRVTTLPAEADSWK